MKAPITVMPITIETEKRNEEPNYIARCKGFKMRATSTSTAESAARNLALRWFFGANTKSAGIGEAEHNALELRRLGGNSWRVSLKGAV
jgi:hypothetical protein